MANVTSGSFSLAAWNSGLGLAVTKYDPAGEKTEELVQDKDGKQVKKIKYAHNSKGLKTEKKTYDANNNLISTKKISYTYR